MLNVIICKFQNIYNINIICEYAYEYSIVDEYNIGIKYGTNNKIRDIFNKYIVYRYGNKGSYSRKQNILRIFF